jgi:hypothetical protein
MATQITFSVLDNSKVVGSGTGGSGVGFYGANGFGTSVPLLSYQGTTFLTNAAGTANGGQIRNNKYIPATLGSSGVQLYNTTSTTGILTKMNSTEATLAINFSTDTAVRVQNCQLRIYDRDNIDNPASGVLTKVAEIVNFGGSTYASWVASPGTDFPNNCGSGDAFWWGAPWEDTYTYGGADVRPYYQNSVGVQFFNFTKSMDTANSGNPHTNLSSFSYPGKQTVGGTGIIVPLLDSPGSGGSGLSTGNLYPKFFQYVNTSFQVAPHFGAGTAAASGTSTNMSKMYGGTGADSYHTWRVAISAAPTSIGSKTQYGMYVSLEYL